MHTTRLLGGLNRGSGALSKVRADPQDSAWPETDPCKRGIIHPRFKGTIVCREDEP
jgi:hypothetical protein